MVVVGRWGVGGWFGGWRWWWAAALTGTSFKSVRSLYFLPQVSMVMGPQVNQRFSCCDWTLSTWMNCQKWRLTGGNISKSHAALTLAAADKDGFALLTESQVAAKQ